MFYGEKLESIRELYGYSRKELADHLNITEQAVWQYEQNISEPRFEISNAFKQLFHVQSSFFYTSLYIKNVSSLENIAYREKAKGSRKKAKMEQFFLNYLYQHLKQIEEKIVPEAGVLNDLKRDIVKQYNCWNLTNTTLKQIASFARQKIGLEENRRLMYKLEIAGAYIIERKLELEVDAYSAWVGEDKEKPIIVLNKGKNTSARRNFDMAHELGHLLLHGHVNMDELDRKEMTQIEKEANQFASFFLIPEEEFTKDVMSLKKKSNPKSYIPLKSKYYVSIQALEYRAFQLGMLSVSEHKYFWRMIHSYGYKKQEPLDDELVVYIPGKIRSLLQRGLDANLFNLVDMLERYKIDVDFLEYLYGISDDLLRNYLYIPSPEYGYENIFQISDFN